MSIVQAMISFCGVLFCGEFVGLTCRRKPILLEFRTEDEGKGEGRLGLVGRLVGWLEA